MADLYADLLADFPWLKSVGITPARIQQLVATSAGTSELYTKMTNEPQWRARFAGNYRQDGSLRMSPAEYLNWESNVRTLLRQAGVDVDTEYATPTSLIGFAESEQSPDELRTRLQVWQQVKQSGERVREAFYVYAGLSPTDDDLFEAAVDPAREQELASTYNAAVAAQASGPDAWKDWITRATEVGLQRVAKVLTDAQTQGTTTGAAIQRVMNTDAGFARQIMDVIYTGGDPTPGKAGSLSLDELLDAFEFMAVGAAATEAGLEMPTLDRLAEIRSAGVEKAKMIAGYTAFGQNRGTLTAAVERARGTSFTQTDFEKAQFFGDAEAANALNAGQNYTEASGRSSGGFRFGEQAGRIVQSGFRG